jgi:hypothetical protein
MLIKGTAMLWKVGQRFDLLEEDVHGTITDVLLDETGVPYSLVVAMLDGQFAAVDLDKINVELAEASVRLH